MKGAEMRIWNEESRNKEQKWGADIENKTGDKKQSVANKGNWKVILFKAK